MNKHFVCQLTDARLMTKSKQYLKKLNCINKQHNFIVLRTLYGDEARIKPPNPYREMWPINFTNKKIQSCQGSDGKFSLEDGSAQLTSH